MPAKRLQRDLIYLPQRQIADMQVQVFQELGVAATIALVLVIQQKPEAFCRNVRSPRMP